MIHAGGRIELFVGAAETEFEDEVLRGGVGGVMACEEGLGAKFVEGEVDDGTLIYLLVKPLARWRVVLWKYVVAVLSTGAVMVHF